MTKHIVNNNPEEQLDFLKSVYNDLAECHDRGVNTARVCISGVLDLLVVDSDGRMRCEEKISIEVRLTSIADLLEGNRLAFVSILGSLLDENDLRTFDYELLELDKRDLE